MAIYTELKVYKECYSLFLQLVINSDFKKFIIKNDD